MKVIRRKVIYRRKSAFALKLIPIACLMAFFTMMAVCTSVGIAQPSFTQEEVAKLDSYAKIIGQATACNVDCRDEVNKIWDWLEKRMDEGYPDRLFKFTDDSAMHNFLQVDDTTLSCDATRETFFFLTNIDCPKLTCAEVKRIFYATEFDLP